MSQKLSVLLHVGVLAFATCCNGLACRLCCPRSAHSRRQSIKVDGHLFFISVRVFTDNLETLRATLAQQQNSTWRTIEDLNRGDLPRHQGAGRVERRGLAHRRARARSSAQARGRSPWAWRRGQWTRSSSRSGRQHTSRGRCAGSWRSLATPPPSTCSQIQL